MKSSSGAISLGMKPEVRPGRSRLHGTNLTVTRCAHRACEWPPPVVTPLPGNVWPRTVFLVQRDELDEITVTPQKAAPANRRLPAAARHDRFVHQVVAEDGRALGASLGNGLPELGLGVPPLLLAEPVVPRGHIFLSVAAQTCDVEVQPQCSAKATDGPGDPVRLVGFAVRAGHNSLTWRWTRTTFGPKLLHLLEVGLDLGPLLFPVVFQEAALVVVIVVETPGHEGLI